MRPIQLNPARGGAFISFTFCSPEALVSGNSFYIYDANKATMRKLREAFGGRRKKERFSCSEEVNYPQTSQSSAESSFPLDFPDGVEVLYDCPDATVDICFVHGLTGDRITTWTAPAQSNPWPKTLLPSKLSTARILTYGYDAYVVRKSVAGSNRLIDHATNLLNDLTTDRDLHSAASRPIIFVAHSLGGLVCKKAILQSRNNPDAHLRSIFNSTKGIVFMGTPHKGSWMADWADIPAGALGLVKSTGKSLLDILRTDNQLLEAIQVDFWSMVRELRESGRRLEVICFFEELPLPIVGKVVSKQSATLEGYNLISVHANHRDMVKFSSANDNGFKRLLGELVRWESDASQNIYLNSVTQSNVTDQIKQYARDKLIAKFCPPGSHPYMDRVRLIPNRHPGTCDWFLHHENYNTWLRSEDVNLLLVSADPGCGKSVLAKALAEEDLNRKLPGAAIFYFFFEQPYQNSVLDALCAIIHQLFDKFPRALDDKLESKIIRAGDVLTRSYDKLTEIFKEASDNIQTKQIVCVLDALDECEATELADLTKWLKSAASTKDSCPAGWNSSIPRMKFVVTTRGLPEILEHFEDIEIGYLRVSGEKKEQADGIQNDVNLVMEARFDKLAKRLNQEQRNAVWDCMIATGAGQRTYLWVKLIFEELGRNKNLVTKVLLDLVRSPPSDIFGAYELLLKRVKDKESYRVQWLLHLMFSALRPLTLREMNVAIQIMEQPDVPSENSLDLMSDQQFRDWIIDTCGFFVTEYDGRLFFVHSTAREYLQTSAMTSVQSKLRSFRGSITENSAHATMAKSCVLYLSMHEFEGRHIEICINISGASLLKVDPTECSFLEYAARNWTLHFQEGRDFSMLSAAMNLCDPQSQKLQAWFPLHCAAKHSSIPTPLTHLMIACYTGLDTLVQELLSRGVAVDKQDMHGWTALHWATILGSGAGVLRMGNGFELRWEAHGTSNAIVECLVNKEAAALSLQDNAGWTALHWATILGSAAGVLHMGNGFELRCSPSDTCNAIVERLVDKGATALSLDK
ncbi:hypothetical protein ASPCAL12341 [Aspergillus calidoustus]|uniref:Nephrocystin 3-like N-terminal domain-containing protein n=1 Tax=Aspergillus calidoustus TaxID=454130 RepID=A0A0U5GAD3_ASPCI|nr:hypothetical protein ASPCAL12341 [Aspergillus calidoustus]